MSDLILVSVVIPCYNSEPFIEKCLRSVVSQSYKNIEIILVDDGSTDDSLKKIKSFEDARIKVIEQGNLGACAARNRGLDLASGYYLIFLDSDDWLFDHAIERLVNFSLNLPDDTLAFGDNMRVSSEGRTKKISFPKNPDLKYLIRSNIPTTCSLYPRKFLLNVCGFDEMLIARQEWNLNLRLFLSGYKFINSNVEVYVQRMHDSPGRITNRKVSSDKEFDSFYASVLPLLERNDEWIRREVATKCWSVGRWFALGRREGWGRYWDLSTALSGDDSFLDHMSLRYKILVKIFGIRLAEVIDRVLIRLMMR